MLMSAVLVMLTVVISYPLQRKVAKYRIMQIVHGGLASYCESFPAKVS